MEWYKESAIKAYLETVKLCKLDHERRCCSFWNPGLQNSELTAALAAGTNSQLIIEICSSMTCTTIALAAASRQTGGRFVCILSRPDSLPESLKRMEAVDLLGGVEFLVGEAKDLISRFSNIDFALVDCSNDKFVGLFKMLNFNPKGAILSTNNLLNKGSYERGGCIWQTQRIGDSLQVTRIKRGCVMSRQIKKRWIVQIDSQTGEEHVFLIRRNRSETR
ncbi:uncharacterized protein LOC131051932 [Cryptomeria japonica]|uniref:uncharacterized protein LOC131051932 n=1 Tax=Cryptomeria japonica TaxID=3369 RepID=UPI0027D9DEE3|nr:uncharacterized protein LOC131051932 [Cryptomeria japonica]